MSTCGRTILQAAPVSYIESAPAQTYVSAAQAQTIVQAAPAYTAITSIAAPVAVVDNRWNEYSPEEVQLAQPELPAPDYRCYAAPQVPPGQTRYLKVDEPTNVKNVAQNFNDVRTAVRENNTHIQRNKTIVTNVARNHNHLLRIVTNENNYNHFLTNQVVRVADIHRQRIENIKGETRNFKDFKATQKVENGGCRRDGLIQSVAAAPAQQFVVQQAPAVTVVQQAAPALSVGQFRTMAPATATPVRWVEGQALSVAPASTMRSTRTVLLQ